MMDDVGRGGAAPPHPPYWPAFGRREILGRLIMMIIMIIIITIIIMIIIIIIIMKKK